MQVAIPTIALCWGPLLHQISWIHEMRSQFSTLTIDDVLAKL